MSTLKFKGYSMFGLALIIIGTVVLSVTLSLPRLSIVQVVGTADTYIDSQYSSLNYQNATVLNLMGDSQRILVKFGLPLIPTGYRISSAQIILIVNTVTSTKPLVSLNRITEQWDVKTVTWLNKPAFVQETVFNVTDTQMYSIFITDLFNSWFNETSPNYGIMFSSGPDTGGFTTHSIEGGQGIRLEVDAGLITSPEEEPTYWTQTRVILTSISGVLIFSGFTIFWRGKK